MRVDGLLISVSEQTKDRSNFQNLEKLRLPTVMFDRILDGFHFNTVTSDDEGGAFQMVEKVIHSGYEKIAHLAGYSHTNIGRLRRRGYEKALKKHGINYDPARVIEAGFSEKDGYSSFMKLHQNGNVPEIIFAVTFPVALGALNAAREKGLSIPEDIDLVCFGGSLYNSYLQPAITYVDQPVEELGRKAFLLLLNQIGRSEIPEDQHIILPTRIVQCQTCLSRKN
jgi:LacI family transcriptional regulator